MKNKTSSLYNNQFYILYSLTKRNIKIFLKNKAAVFFSILAPLIVLLLYVLFLGNLQFDNIKTQIDAIGGLESISDHAIRAFLNSWMVSGVISVACITVSFGANSIIVRDRQDSAVNDLLASPIKKSVLTASYLLFNFFATVFIVFVVLIICIIYLLIVSSFYLSVIDIFSIIGYILVSSLSASLLTIFITSFLKNESTLSVLSGIVSAAIGFVIGAYMPTSIYPKWVQYGISVFPGNHSSALLRGSFMRGALENLTNGANVSFKETLENQFSFNINMFGYKTETWVMLLFMLGSIVLFALINILSSFIRYRKNEI